MLIRTVLLSFVLSSISLSAANPSAPQVKKRMLSDLQIMKSVFEVKYAPQVWKKEFANWDIDAEFARVEHKIQTTPNLSVKDYQMELVRLFNSTKDYHVGIHFFSTEEASLPFSIRGTKSNRYYVVWVNKLDMPRSVPMEVGDEIISFAGRPIHEVIQDIKRAEVGDNTPETDQSLAERLLTVRKGHSGHFVPKGDVTFTFKKNKTGKLCTHTLKWNYCAEKIRDYTQTGPIAKAETSTFDFYEGDLQAEIKNSPLFNKMMCAPAFLPTVSNTISNRDNLHEMGAKKSFLPQLGKKVWKGNDAFEFDAYIFQNASGRRIGYIRIPNYFGDAEEAAQFGELINLFELQTEALVIDQVNNPGGSLFYLYALASMLSDQTLIPPKHHIAITQEEVALAVQILPVLELVKDERMAKQVLGESLGGYPITLDLVARMREFFQFIIDEWNEGNLYTSPTNVFGMEQIESHDGRSYTKPILVLINSLDFSGGDFFPAILQDNGRATLLGTRTAGAGGFVLPTAFPNHTGIKSFHLTGSLAKRLDSKPLENLGVVPDIEYSLSDRDYQENYVEYSQAILNTLDSLLMKR